jgi:L-ribulose-5-phosphate 3-epimerase
MTYDIMQVMTRRELLVGALGAASLSAKTKIDSSRISAISDEVGKSPQASIDFAKQYDLQFLELRNVPGGKEYSFLPEDEVKQAAADFERNGIRISFMNSSLLKFGWPGTEPVRRRPETEQARAKRLQTESARFERRMDDLRTAIRNCHILGVDLLRVFTGSRVEEPEKLYPRIVDVLGEMALVCEKEKIRLLIENEGSCNIGTSAELTSLLKLIPSKWIGINWDSLNGLTLHENPFPDGYQVLPKERIYNVQIKGKTLLDYPEKLDWKVIFQTLQKDGYQGKLGLETHIFGEGQVAASHSSMQEILRIVQEL